MAKLDTVDCVGVGLLESHCGNGSQQGMNSSSAFKSGKDRREHWAFIVEWHRNCIALGSSSTEVGGVDPRQVLVEAQLVEHCGYFEHFFVIF